MLGSVVVFTGKSVGADDGPTDTGSVGAGEGTTSETAEDTEGGDTAMTDAVVVAMALEREGETDVCAPTAPVSPSGGAGVEKREDPVNGGVV